MYKCIFPLAAACLLALAATNVDAGVATGLNGGAGGGQPFHFTVCTVQPAGMGMMTSEAMSSGGPMAGEAGSQRSYNILELLQQAGITNVGIFGGNNGNGNGNSKPSGRSYVVLGADGCQQCASGGGGGTTDANEAVNAHSCVCLVIKDFEDGLDGENGSGADEGEMTGGPGPDSGPSVVPEPTTFALWSLALVTMIGITRRRR